MYLFIFRQKFKPHSFWRDISSVKKKKQTHSLSPPVLQVAYKSNQNIWRQCEEA